MRYLTSRLKDKPKNPVSLWSANTPFFDVTQGIFRMVKPIRFDSNAVNSFYQHNRFSRLTIQGDQNLIAFPSTFQCALQPQSASDVQGVTIPAENPKFPRTGVIGTNLVEGAGHVSDRAVSLLMVSKPVQIPAGKKLWFGLSNNGYAYEYGDGRATVACVTAMLRSEWEALPANGFQHCPVTIRVGATLSGTGTINDQSPTWDVQNYHHDVWHPDLNRFSPAHSIPVSTFGFTFRVRDNGSNYISEYTAFNGNGGVFNANWINDPERLYRGKEALALFDFDAKSVEFSRTIPKTTGKTLSAASGSTHTFSVGDEVVFIIEVNASGFYASTSHGFIYELTADNRYNSTAGYILSLTPSSNHTCVFGWEDKAIYNIPGAATIPGLRPYPVLQAVYMAWEFHKLRPLGRKHAYLISDVMDNGTRWSVPTNKVYLETVGLAPVVAGFTPEERAAHFGQRLGFGFDPSVGTFGTAYVYDSTGAIIVTQANPSGSYMHFIMNQRHPSFPFQVITTTSELRNLPSGFVAWDDATY